MIQIQPLNLLPPTTVKRYVQNPDLSTLNDGQQEAMDLFQAFDKDSTANYFILEGWAGTGKTYLASIMIEWLLFNSMRTIEIAMTAPVNDAVKVLKASATFYDERLNYGTLHSLAGLKAQVDKKTGELRFKKDYYKKCHLDNCDYLVIDEGSMLSDELFNIVHRNYVETGKLKVIIVGDGGQIPPIGQRYAIPFSQQGRDDHDMWFYELSTIVRQSEGSPIINFTAGLRDKLSKPNPIILMDSQVEDNKGLLFLDSSKQQEYIQLIKDLFQSDYFQQNPNYCKIICWRNKYVNSFNNVVRKFIFGKDISKIVVGEKMVAADAIMSDYETVVMTNGTKFEVQGLEVKTCKPFNTTEYKYYEASIQTQDYEDESKHTIKIIHEDSELQLKTDISKIFNLAKDEPDGTIRMKLFNSYWNLKRYFAGVSYNYAITAHRSQGSTFQYALVVMEDIYSSNSRIDTKDRNRIGYTACTRPKDLLVMLGDL